MGLPAPHGRRDDMSVAVIGEIGVDAVPVPGRDDVSLPPRGALGIEYDGEVPLGEVPFEAVTGEFRVLLSSDESMMGLVDVVKVCVKVSGKVIVMSPVEAAVGAVFIDEVPLHGVAKSGDDEPTTGLPSVEDSSSDGTGK